MAVFDESAQDAILEETIPWQGDNDPAEQTGDPIVPGMDVSPLEFSENSNLFNEETNDTSTFSVEEDDAEFLVLLESIQNTQSGDNIVELEGISHGPTHELGFKEGSWIVVVDGDILDPNVLPSDENTLDLGGEHSGMIIISDGLGGSEELPFENAMKIAWESSGL